MNWKETKWLINGDLNRLGNTNKWGGGVKYFIYNASFKITF